MSELWPGRPKLKRTILQFPVSKFETFLRILEQPVIVFICFKCNFSLVRSYLQGPIMRLNPGNICHPFKYSRVDCQKQLEICYILQEFFNHYIIIKKRYILIKKKRKMKDFVSQKIYFLFPHFYQLLKTVYFFK